MPEKVVVTGMGTVNPLGLSVAETWKNAINGVSGAGPVTLFDASDLSVQVVCEVKGYDPEVTLSAREARRRERYQQFAATAAEEAMQASGLEITSSNADRVGVVVSSAIGGIQAMEDGVQTMVLEGPRRVSPFTIPMMMPNGAAGLLSMDLGARGPSLSIASACASGADGVGMAWRLIRSGVIDAAIAGGSESTVVRIGMATFDRMGAISRREPGDYHTPQPFDLHRDGFVMAEGAAILILEREGDARARGAEILGEVIGHASTADAYHITAPDESGSGGARAMAQALAAAGVSPQNVDYINAHGTGTPLNDVAETRAIKTVFGEMAYNMPVSSTKSMTGHMMGATGALEAIFCVLAIQDNVVPPTINYETPDPDCDLMYVPNAARELPVRTAITNAFGFGGHNAVLVFREYR